MKIRTRLILLLGAALGVTMAVSTVLRIRWMRQQLEANLRATAQDTAEAMAADLTRRLTPDQDRDEVNETLRTVKLRHPVVDEVVLVWDNPDEDTVSTYQLGSQASETTVNKRARPQKGKGERARTQDARRALVDFGHYARRPGTRLEVPLWRTSDRGDSTRWPERPTVAPPAPSKIREFREGERGSYTFYEVRLPIDPEGPRHGELTVAVTRAPIEQIVRTETISSVLVASGSLLLLMFVTAFIVDRVVSQPVGKLELAMKRVESGALEERVSSSNRQDEIGALERGFDAMIAQVAEADASIRAFNRRLADEVRAATSDLAQKNTTLETLNQLLIETRRELGDKERLAALGQLAAQLAHEIGTPLASVSGHLQLAMSRRDLPQPLRERLQVAEREITRISHIVRDYLDSTRRVVPQLADVDMDRVIDEALGVALGRRPVQVERTVAAGARQLRTDPGLVRQILINLLTNAADAVAHNSKGGGRIAIEATRRDDEERIAVRDDGAGIAADDLARIFEPFYTTKGRGKGTGLGLAICRELAAALGGKIAVDSAPGRGSVFTLTLPITVAAA